MSLIQCPDCGSEMSDKAPACPKCGCPPGKTAPMQSASSVPGAPERARSGGFWGRMFGLLLGGGLALWGGLMLYGNFMRNQEPPIQRGLEPPSIITGDPRTAFVLLFTGASIVAITILAGVVSRFVSRNGRGVRR